jgi:hypothetical protein
MRAPAVMAMLVAWLCVASPAGADSPSVAFMAVAAPAPKGKNGKAAKVPKPILPPVLKPDDSQAPARVDSSMLDRAYKRAQAMRNVGIGLAAPGLTLTVLGTVVAFSAISDPNLFDQGSKIFGGALSAAIGLAISIPGVYFWTSGQDDMDSVTWRRRELMRMPP